jgi:hypothetical protein
VELLRLARQGDGYREELSHMLEALARGVSPRVVRDTIQFARWACIQPEWTAAQAGACFDAERVMDLLLRAEASDDRALCRHIWWMSVKHSRLAQLLGARWWDALDAAGVNALLWFLGHGMGCTYSAERAPNAKIEALVTYYLTLTPEQQDRARTLPDHYFLYLPGVFAMVDRIPKQAINADVEWRHFLDPFRSLPPRERHAFASAPQGSLDILLKAYRRRNECTLVSQGLETLCKAMPAQAVAVFRSAPKHLLHAARFIGALDERHGVEVLRPLRRHELFTADVADGDIVALDNLLGRNAALAKRLRRFHEWDQHFSGRKLMPLSGVMQAFEELRSQIALMAIWHAENAVKEHLAFDPHTYAVLRNSWKNRRVLARFLRKPHLDFIDAHPATQAWRKRHADVDVDRWRRGVPFERDGVRLTMEHDYREVLRMGTYVGSCLGLGGFNMFNAATVLLDINKQVIFARGADGKFVARQLVAIDDKNRLVCFPVYAVDDRDKWQPLFADYNRALAWSLGLPIHTAWDYQIPNVIARDWYDDGLWDLVLTHERIAA